MKRATIKKSPGKRNRPPFSSVKEASRESSKFCTEDSSVESSIEPSNAYMDASRDTKADSFDKTKISLPKPPDNKRNSRLLGQPSQSKLSQESYENAREKARKAILRNTPLAAIRKQSILMLGLSSTKEETKRSI